MTVLSVVEAQSQGRVEELEGKILICGAEIDRLNQRLLEKVEASTTSANTCQQLAKQLET